MKKILYYLGNDNKFSAQMQTYYDDVVKEDTHLIVHINAKADWVEKLSMHLNDKLPHALIINFAFFKLNLFDLCQFIYFFHNNSNTKNVPIIGIFETKDQLLENIFLTAYGLIYFYISESDIERFLIDSYFLIFYEKILVKKFANSGKMSYEHKAHCIGMFKGIHNEHLLIDTDLPLLKDESIKVNIDSISILNDKTFLVDKGVENFENCFLETLKLNIPFAGPWDDINENSLTKDIFDQWLEKNFDSLSNHKINVLFICDSFDVFETLVKMKADPSYNFLYKSKLDPKMKIILECMPDIIFIQQDIEVENEEVVEEDPDAYCTEYEEEKDILIPNDIELVRVMLKKISKLAYSDGEDVYNPFIFVCNSDCPQEEVKTKFLDAHVISTKDLLTIPFVQKILSMFAQKIKPKFGGNKFFPVDKRKSILYLDIDITVTSLAEDIITFESKTEIPLYSTLIMKKPMHVMITNIPPLKEMEKIKGKYNYMGLISGTTEKDQEFLRMFVNYLIQKKPDVFDYSIPKKEIVDVRKTQIKVENVEAEKQKILNEANEALKSDRFVVQRPIGLNKKSKL